MSSLFRALILVVLVASGAAAQLEVAVTDTAGRGVPGARVELWSSATLLAGRATDADGVATFSADDASRITDVLVRSIGFAPRRISVTEADGRVAVQLERLAQSLPAVTVASVAQTCPQTEQPDARALWLRVSGRYREPASEGRRTMVDQRQATVTERDVGFFDEQALRTGWREYTPAGVSGGQAQLERRVYLTALTGPHSHDLFGGWRYPALEAELAGHFATPAFGAAHTFAVASRASTSVTLRFCARDRRGSGLDGTLQLSERDGLIEARWRYWNPSRDAEQAGGAATFASAGADGLPDPLTSTTGLFWRRLPSGQFVQRWQRFHEWQLYVEGQEDAPVTSPAATCSTTTNYVLCSAIRVNGFGGASSTSCSSMPYRCYED